MSASSEDAFYSAPDASPDPSENPQQPLSTSLNPNPSLFADQNQQSTLSMPRPDNWLLGMASSAGKVISSVLGLSEGSGSDDESDGTCHEMLSLAEGEDDEFHERIKELNQGRELDRVEELKAILPLTKSKVTVAELVARETFSREQSEKLINLVQSRVVESSSPFSQPNNVSSQNQLVQMSFSPVASVEMHSVAVPEAKKWSEENRSTSSSFTLPPNPNPSPSSLLPGQNQPQPLSNIIPPVNPSLSSPSLSQNQQPPTQSAPPPNPKPNLSSTNQKRPSAPSSPLSPNTRRQSKPCSKRHQPGAKSPLTSSNHGEELKMMETPALISDPMAEDGYGDRRLSINLKEVIELFSGDLDAQKHADMDLLDVLEIKGITFEDPPWWPK